MRNFVVIAFLCFHLLVSGQCVSTYTAPNIYYPNSVNTPTTFSYLFEYLCGPNTVVYDTIPSWGCHYVYVNPSCTLILNNTTICPAVNNVWLKNNSTLVLLGNNDGTYVFYEPSATIINTAGAPTVMTSCPSISFPTVNCATSLNEINKSDVIRTWPMPASTKLHIDFNPVDEFFDVKIIDHFGKTVFQNPHISSATNEIPVDNLLNGIYLLVVRTNSEQYIQKLIVLH